MLNFLVPYFIFSLPGVLLVAAIVAGLNRRSWARFFISLFLVAFWIMIPLFVFIVSAGLVPDWKGGCHLGWLDCFHAGKLALLPLVLWASAAWYAVGIYRVSDQTRKRPWIVLGVFQGAIVSSICLMFGLESIPLRVNGPRIFLLVPLVVVVGYSIRAAQLMRAAKLRLAAYLTSLLLAAPFWIASIVWSKQIFAALPDKSPDCFVVTAASRGHPALVGPFTEITHRGRRRWANRQLVTFWQFEERWQRRAPASHAAFRRSYNRVGPMLARHLTHRWLADLAWLALKPAELLARLATRNAG